jgi:hypothetical protein
MHSVRRAFLDDPPPKTTGAIVLDRWATAIKRMMACRDRFGEERFIDIRHRDQITDPDAVLRSVYHWLGWTFEDAMSERLAQWRSENPKGRHHADPAVFGLDEQGINATYAPYIARFSSFF